MSEGRKIRLQIQMQAQGEKTAIKLFLEELEVSMGCNSVLTGTRAKIQSSLSLVISSSMT